VTGRDWAWTALLFLPVVGLIDWTLVAG